MEEKEFHTSAGLLSGVINERVDKSGILRSCMFQKQNVITVRGEKYIPKFGEDDFRTRFREAITFYKNGKLKSIYLEKQQEIASPAGRILAELVTFYESGSLQRIFPVYGQINGYWSESEESTLLEPYELEIGGQRIKVKISCFSFYASGALKSITLWPGEKIDILTPAGSIRVRYGISFYESGRIESVEPEQPVIINENNHIFFAFDNHPIGVHGDKNSLNFYENGSLKSLKTTITAVILPGENEEHKISPEYKMSLTDPDKMEIVPIGLEFHERNLTVTDSDGFKRKFTLDQPMLRTEQIYKNLSTSVECTDCNSCSKCGH